MVQAPIWRENPEERNEAQLAALKKMKGDLATDPSACHPLPSNSDK